MCVTNSAAIYTLSSISLPSNFVVVPLQHAGSYFPHQGCPLQWKLRVLTTGLSGNFPSLVILCWPCTYATATLRSHKILAVNHFLAFVLFFTVWFLARKSSLTRTKFFFFFNYWTWEKWSESCSVMSDSLPPHGLYSLWNSPGQNSTGVGSLSLLQGSSRPRDRTQVSCIAVRFFTSGATRSMRDT